MILIDDRIGSRDLVALLKPLGVPAEMVRLDFGDAAFVGQGPNGTPAQVGVELKTVSDALQCMTNGRFAGHQLPGLVQQYDHVWLLIEGAYRPSDPDGLLEVRWKGGFHAIHHGQRRYMYKEFDAWLTTLQVKAGVRVWRSWDRTETARWLATLYHWWCDKPWEEHKSHLAFHPNTPDAALLRRPSFTCTLAAQLPGVGWDRAQAAADYFPSVLAMMTAGEEDWRRVKGVGKGVAAKVVNSIRQVDNPKARAYQVQREVPRATAAAAAATTGRRRAK